MKKIIWAQTALIDLENLHDYISQDSSFYADVLCSEILQAIDRLEKFPQLGRKVPEYNDDITREIIVNDYRIIYEITIFRVNILTIIHGARLLKKE